MAIAIGPNSQNPTGDMAMNKRVRIAIVALHPLFRVGVVNLLRRSDNFDVVAEGETADDAIRIATDPALHILLLDIEDPGHVIEAVRAIGQPQPKARIIILSASDEEERVVDALRAGAQGYVLKEVDGRGLVAAVKAVHRGEPHIAEPLASRLVSRLVTQSETMLSNTNRIDLSSRQRQILNHLAEGLTNREIALKLGLTIRTIKQHMMLLFSKIGVRNRVEAIMFCDRHRKNGARGNQVRH